MRLAILLLGLTFCPGFPGGRLAAQTDFEREYTFKEIRDMFNAAYKPRRDLRREALAWYFWARYDERSGGARDSVLSYLDNSAQYFLQAGDTLFYHRVQGEIADRLVENGPPGQALRLHREALAFFRARRDTLMETHALAHLYRLCLVQGDTVQAAVLKNEVNFRNSHIKDPVIEIKMLMEEVLAFQRQGKHRDAAQRAFLIEGIAKRIDNLTFQTWAYYNIGLSSQYTGNYASALHYLHLAEKYGRRSATKLRHDIYRHLAQTYEAIDSLPAALRYAQQFGALTDTLLAESGTAVRAHATLAFDRENRRRDEINLRKQVNLAQSETRRQQLDNLLLLAWLAGGGVTLSLLVFMLWQRHRSSRIIARQTAELKEQEIRKLEDKLKIETMQSMLEGVESERQRIAHDLHDSLGGLLAAAKIQLENLPARAPQLAASAEWHKVKSLLNDTVEEARHIARNLLPGALLRFGLVAAIQDLASRVRGEGLPTITFQHFGDFSDLAQHVALNCYRIVQELLQNSLKHAHATEILVQLTRTDTEIALLVEDNGQGFDPASAPKGMGTQNVAQRVQFLRGELSVQTAPGEGVSVHVTVPLTA